MNKITYAAFVLSLSYHTSSFSKIMAEPLFWLNHTIRTCVCQQLFRTYFRNVCLLFTISYAIIFSSIIICNRRREIPMEYGRITDKQREILEYIKQEILNKGYPPTVREMCDAVHLKSTSSIHSHLESLEKNGYIRRDPSKPRTIEIVDDNFNLTRREVVNVPVVGSIAAGQPLLAVQNIDNYFPIPSEYIPNQDTFMLHVKGESMINAGIFDGDVILVKQQNTARNGEIVAALVDDSATVKTFYKEAGHIRLQPENDTMDPIIVTDCQILGVVFGVFRFF